MGTFSILPIFSPDGETLYQAVAGKLTSLEKTPGQALGDPINEISCL